MPGNKEGGDHMARKKTLEELQAEREKAEQDLRMRQENLKKLKQKEAELTRTYRAKNYDDKRGVIYTEIMLPDNAPREYADRNTLWNAVEWSETNWNAQMARKLHITLPKELSMDDNLKLIREYV